MTKYSVPWYGKIKSANQVAIVRPDNNGDIMINPFSLPEWMMINGNLYASIVSNTIKIDILTLSWNSPTMQDPVYIRIDNIVRSITSAFSQTIPIGNRFNAWSSELATKSIQFFVYIGWNTTQSELMLWISRIPYGRTISDFNTSTTMDDKYIRLSTWNNVWWVSINSNDRLSNIWRYTASLSLSPYNWSWATNIINRPIYETDWLQWTASISFNWTAPTWLVSSNYFYKIQWNNVLISALARYTNAWSNNNNIDFTLPFSFWWSGNFAASWSVNMEWNVVGNWRFRWNGANLWTIKCPSSAITDFCFTWNIVI